MKNGERLSPEHLPDRSEECLRVGTMSCNPPDGRQSRMMSQRSGSRPSRSGCSGESRWGVYAWQGITSKLQKTWQFSAVQWGLN